MTSVSSLQNVEVFADNTEKVNGADDVYQVIVTANTPIIDGDMLYLQFPDEIGFPATNADLSCEGLDGITVSCSIQPDQVILASFDSLGGNDIGSGDQVSFNIDSLTNPISLRQTGMVDIQLQDSDGFQVNSYPDAVDISTQNTDVAYITDASLVQGSSGPLEETSYTFTFVPTNPIPQNAIIQVNYFAGVVINIDSCEGITGIPSG